MTVSPIYGNKTLDILILRAKDIPRTRVTSHTDQTLGIVSVVYGTETSIYSCLNIHGKVTEVFTCTWCLLYSNYPLFSWISKANSSTSNFLWKVKTIACGLLIYTS